MGRDPRCVAPPGSEQRASFHADLALSRARTPARRSFAVVRRVTAGECLPRGYGVAWASFERAGAVCLPIPFNVLAGRVRSVWLWFKRGGLPLAGDPASAFAEGVRHGIGIMAGYLDPED